MRLTGDPLERAGAFLFAGGAQFVLMLVVAESVYPGYSVSLDPISNLGATCGGGSCIIPPSSWIFNGSVFLLGLLAFIGSFFIYGSRFRLVGGLAAVSAWGVMGVGLFPETAGVLHTVVSLIAFLFGGLTAILSYRMLRAPLSYFAVILGMVGLTALVLYGSGTDLGLGRGGMERLIAFPELVWLLGFSAHLMGRHDEGVPSFPP